MLAPEIREQIVGLAEVRDVFKSPNWAQLPVVWLLTVLLRETCLYGSA